MIVGNRNDRLYNEIDRGISSTDTNPNTSNLSNSDIDKLINSLCQTRMENDDVLIMDDINNGKIPEINSLKLEEMNEKIIEDMIEADILKDLFERNSPDISIEEVNMLKANGLYNKYLNIKNKKGDIDMINDIEEEIMRDLNSEEKEVHTKGIEEKVEFTEETITEVESFPEADVEIVENMDTIASEENTEIVDVNPEEIQPILDDDILVSELKVEDEDVVDKIKEEYGNIDDQDVLDIIDVMKRYQSGEKFNVYSSLPKILRDEIDKSAMEVGVVDRSTINFFAKNFINDLISNTYINKEFKNFQEELEEVTKPMDNVQGLIIDTYTDDLKTKFEDNMLEYSDKTKETDPEKSERFKRIAENFKASYTLSKIINSITEKPSLINRAYKDARDNFNKIQEQFDEKFKDSKPRVKSLKTVLAPLMFKLGYSDDMAKTFAVLINNSILAETSDGTMETHIYAYFVMLGFVNINLTANSSQLTKSLCEAILNIMNSIESYMTAINSSKKGKKKRR